MKTRVCLKCFVSDCSLLFRCSDIGNNQGPKHSCSSFCLKSNQMFRQIHLVYLFSDVASVTTLIIKELEQNFSFSNIAIFITP